MLVALQQAGQASGSSNSALEGRDIGGHAIRLFGLQVLVALQQAGQASGSGTSARLDSIQGDLADTQQTLVQLAQQHATEKASRLQDAAAAAKRLQVGFPAACVPAGSSCQCLQAPGGSP